VWVDRRVLDLLRRPAARRHLTITASGDGPGAIDLLLAPGP
jgi:hypothetical protein